MIIEHAGRSPRIDPTAWVAPDATLCGDVVLGPGARVLHGARLIGEAGGRISIGRETIVMENAVVRATGRTRTALIAHAPDVVVHDILAHWSDVYEGGRSIFHDDPRVHITLVPIGDGLTLALDEPAVGVAPGQLACLMDGETIVGHATISARSA